MAIDLAALKLHCNVVGTDDDAVLTRLLAAATSHLQGQLGFAIDDDEELDASGIADVEQAVIMLAAHWYENREASIVGVSIMSVPMGVADIIANRRRYSFAAGEE
jgi:uncharacterized phage protein (predicted DNA packaging)